MRGALASGRGQPGWDSDEDGVQVCWGVGVGGADFLLSGAGSRWTVPCFLPLLLFDGAEGEDPRTPPADLRGTAWEKSNLVSQATSSAAWF